MSVKGPIIIIEDDADDQQIVSDILKDLQIENKVLFFATAPAAIEFLIDTTEQPFLIISDVNLPGMSGVEMRQVINENEHLKRKAIPFIFFTTSAKKEAVTQAYEMMVQGYFEKPDSISAIRESIKMIIDYWKVCLHPNTYT